MHAGVIQRPGGLDVDGRADTAGGRAGTAGLEHLDAGDRLGRQVGEVERTRVGGVGFFDAGARHLAAVQQHQVEVRADATHGDARAFAQRAVDRHTADALQRFGQVGIREFADVFGHDAVDDALRIAFDVHRRGKAAANTADLDGIEGGGIGLAGTRDSGCRLRRRRGLRGQRSRQGEQQGRRQAPRARQGASLSHGSCFPKQKIRPAPGGTGKGQWNNRAFVIAALTKSICTAASAATLLRHTSFHRARRVMQPDANAWPYHRAWMATYLDRRWHRHRGRTPRMRAWQAGWSAASALPARCLHARQPP